MNKLVNANMTRLFKDRVLYICLACMFIIGVWVSIKAEVAIDQVFYSFSILSCIASAAFCGLYIGTEYSDGTLRNKLIVGHLRGNVYLSTYVTCVLAGVMMCLSFMLPVLSIGILRMGGFTAGAAGVTVFLLIALLLLIALTSVFTLIGMLMPNKASGAVINLILILALSFTALLIQSRLDEPEYFSSYSYTDSSGTHYEDQTKNEDYLTGTKRDIYQFMYEFLPTGQALQLPQQRAEHPYNMMAYSILITLFTSCAGLALFQKKDIK